MVSFEIFVKAMPPSLSELKVLPWPHLIYTVVRVPLGCDLLPLLPLLPLLLLLLLLAAHLLSSTAAAAAAAAAAESQFAARSALLS